MNNSYFHIIVKKMINYRWKIISNDLIKKWLEKMLDEDYSDAKMYKTLHKLKNKGEIFALKKNIFVAKAPWKDFLESEIIDKYYREVLKKHCKTYIEWRRYIWWLKALELNTSNYWISDDILIINEHKTSVETVIMEKKMLCKTYNYKTKNLFSIFYKFTNKLKIWKYTLPVANLELSLLESLYNPPLLLKWYTEELIKKIIRKQKKSININTFATIIKNNKHHSSLNRFYQLAKYVDPWFAEEINEIIKKYSYLMTSNI